VALSQKVFPFPPKTNVPNHYSENYPSKEQGRLGWQDSQGLVLGWTLRNKKNGGESGGESGSESGGESGGKSGGESGGPMLKWLPLWCPCLPKIYHGSPKRVYAQDSGLAHFFLRWSQSENLSEIKPPLHYYTISNYFGRQSKYKVEEKLCKMFCDFIMIRSHCVLSSLRT
jgi:hypothetical protein